MARNKKIQKIEQVRGVDGQTVTTLREVLTGIDKKEITGVALTWTKRGGGFTTYFDSGRDGVPLSGAVSMLQYRINCKLDGKD